MPVAVTENAAVSPSSAVSDFGSVVMVGFTGALFTIRSALSLVSSPAVLLTIQRNTEQFFLLPKIVESTIVFNNYLKQVLCPYFCTWEGQFYFIGLLIVFSKEGSFTKGRG